MSNGNAEGLSINSKNTSYHIFCYQPLLLSSKSVIVAYLTLNQNSKVCQS